MAIEPREKGPTAQRVAANVRELRKARGLSLHDLSERLDELGQPVSLNGLSEVENGKRRVDVDDLVALAIALGVTPNRLLLTATADTEQLLSLTPDQPEPWHLTTEGRAWRWAAGEDPLAAPWFEGGVPADPLARSALRHSELRANRQFRDENRPHVVRDTWTTEQLRGHIDDLRPVSQAVMNAVNAGVPLQTLLGWFVLTHGISGADAALAMGHGVDDGEH